MRIGYIDDDFDLIETYRELFKKENIEIITPEYLLDKQGIISWIINNNLKVILVDYKLSGKFSFNGTELIAYINSCLPNIQCILLTAYKEESIDEKLVINNLIVERSSYENSDAFVQFANLIKEAEEIFDKRLNLDLLEYEELLKKKNSQNISSEEEVRLVNLSDLLRKYGELDDEVPAVLKKTEIEKKVDNLLNLLGKIIK
jgi:FOG: CheY-like receiver